MVGDINRKYKTVYSRITSIIIFRELTAQLATIWNLILLWSYRKGYNYISTCQK